MSFWSFATTKLVPLSTWNLGSQNGLQDAPKKKDLPPRMCSPEAMLRLTEKAGEWLCKRGQCAAFPFHWAQPMQLCLWMYHECKKNNCLKITWTLNIQYFTINSVMTECKMESFVTVGQLITNDSVASFSLQWRDYWKTIFLKYSLAPAWLLTHPMKHLFSLVGVSKAEPSGRMPAHAAWITFHTLHPV